MRPSVGTSAMNDIDPIVISTRVGTVTGAASIGASWMPSIRCALAVVNSIDGSGVPAFATQPVVASPSTAAPGRSRGSAESTEEARA
jgi:hypothetical protein